MTRRLRIQTHDRYPAKVRMAYRKLVEGTMDPLEWLAISLDSTIKADWSTFHSSPYCAIAARMCAYPGHHYSTDLLPIANTRESTG
ncbi:uncharacterized protein ARMOST_11508 [Armillaria ostoyae]|uniref:Uncharacterized protein n=1 Tax=Armillaria ostoyae TaxID=47428 RepID=A0A284RHC1_ARMOS|nr:uncharacterized protein ARMOST_11508 [Armillaria ostoyae]